MSHFALRTDSYRVHKVSEAQGEALMTALDTVDVYNLCNFHGFSHKDTALFETCKEILGTVGDCDDHTSSDDEDAASDPDTEQEFYDSVDTMTVADEQVSEPAD